MFTTSLVCVVCQSSKVQCHTKSPVGTFLLPSAHFDHVLVNIVGLILLSQGLRYLLVIADCFTCWPEAIPISEVTAQAFVLGWVFRFGLP